VCAAGEKPEDVPKRVVKVKSYPRQGGADRGYLPIELFLIS